MSETKKLNRTTYYVFGKEKEIQVKNANEQPLNVLNIPNMEISVEGYEIKKDPKTGKILRVQDKRTLSEITKEKYDRILKEAKRRESKEQGR